MSRLPRRFSGGTVCPTGSIGNTATRIPVVVQRKSSRSQPLPRRKRIHSGRGPSTCRGRAPFLAARNAARCCRIFRIRLGNARSAASTCTPANSANILTRPAASNAISRFPPESRPKTSATTVRCIPYGSWWKRKLPAKAVSAPMTRGKRLKIYSRSEPIRSGTIRPIRPSPRLSSRAKRGICSWPSRRTRRFSGCAKNRSCPTRTIRIIESF
jgi:hypothetical protein